MIEVSNLEVVDLPVVGHSPLGCRFVVVLQFNFLVSMDYTLLSDFPLPENIIRPLMTTSKSSTLVESLEIFIEASRTADGRSDLASKNILSSSLQLVQFLSYHFDCHLLLLSLKLIRNICAGEMANQNSFIEQNGIKIVSTILISARTNLESSYGIIRLGLQVLGNISLAGECHQLAVWHQFFPEEFLEISKIRKRDICDPLCMVLYTGCDGNPSLLSKLCGDQGVSIVAEIVRTASTVGFGEDWLKLLLSRICLEELHFHPMFSKLCPTYAFGKFASEQAFLLSIISEILNERLNEITVPCDFALCVLEIFKRATEVVDFTSRGKIGLPTSSTPIDVLGYSLTILRDICASKEGSVDVVNLLLSSGLLALLLRLLRDLEPPAVIRRANQGTAYLSTKFCPYKGFRRDIVAVIGNSAYHRKCVQDEIRDKNGLLLLLQQCVTDDDNPYLREWGIWCIKNLLEGNVENQQQVAELELQGAVDVSELARVGLGVEVDQNTRRVKLVNIP